MKRTEIKRKTGLKRTGFKTRKARRTPVNQFRRDKKASHSKAMASLRSTVIARDGHVCRMCVAAREGKFITDRPHPELKYQNMKLELHHIHGRLGDLLLDADNCITLCTWHHLYSKFGPHNGPKKFETLLGVIREQKETRNTAVAN